MLIYTNVLHPIHRQVLSYAIRQDNYSETRMALGSDREIDSGNVAIFEGKSGQLKRKPTAEAEA